MAFIVLADDDEIICEIVQEAFWNSGHILGAVSDGKAVLELLKRKTPDLLILDCNMPELSGLELLRRLRLSKQHYRLPVIIQTARSSREDMQIAMTLGANSYVTKPYSPAQLVHRVETMLFRDDAQREAARRSARRFV